MKQNNLVKQITLSGLLLALVIICTRLLSLQNIPVIPFVRISLGPALIVFTSLYLGPISGLIVGAASDILGIVLFPNALGYSINPLFTVIYGLLGLFPWFIYQLIKKVNSEKITFSFLPAILGLLCGFVVLFVCLNDSMTLFGKTYEFLTWHKWVISIGVIVLSALTLFLLMLTKHQLEKKYGEGTTDVYHIAVTVTIVEIIVMLIGNTLVKTFYFEVDFLVVLFSQAIVFFIDIPLNTFVCALLMRLIQKVNL